MVTRQRRVTPREVLGGLVASVTVAMALIAVSSGPVASGSAPHVKAGAALTTSTLGAQTELDAIDMLSTSDGFGVASRHVLALSSPTASYLVRTGDGAREWRVVGELPVTATAAYQPRLNFTSQRVGYFTSSADSAMYVTTDGGTTWSLVHTPGVQPTYALADSTLVTSSATCAANDGVGTSDCPSELSFYDVGATQPTVSVQPPGTSTTPLLVLSSSSVVILDTTTATTSALLETTTRGSTWRSLSDPCPSSTVSELLAPPTRGWLLLCQPPEGPSGGNENLMWKSTDDGSTWTALHNDNSANVDVGNAVDASPPIVASNDGALLYGSFDGPTASVQYSTDGGTTWLPTETGWQGTDLVDITPVGARGAIAADAQAGGYFETTNGVTWSSVFSPPPGRVDGLSYCSTRGHVLARLTSTRDLRGTMTYGVTLTNQGSKSCYVYGAPVVQATAKPGGAAIGPAGNGYSDNTDPTVSELKADGGDALALFQVVAASSYTTPAQCVATSVSNFELRFTAVTSFSVTVRAPVKVCTRTSNVLAESVLGSIPT